MSEKRAERRLAAILAADVAGYSRLMGGDEEGTLAALKSQRRELLDPKIAEHHGRIVKTTGDGMLVEFQSVVDALRCAIEMQREMAERNKPIPEGRRIEWRIGINLGDIIGEEGDIYGDGVNIAARLEAVAEPGGICVSRVVRDQVRDKLDLAFEDLGEQSLKNIARPVRVYRIALTRLAPAALGTLSRIAGEEGPSPQGLVGEGSPPALPLPDKPSIAVLPFQNMSGDPEQEYFADGMVEEIITALSRIRWLFVIARNSSFTYKGQAVDVKRVGRELGVRYVLEGSVRKGGNRVRITGQLIDAETSAHLWADRFDGSLNEVFELQDKVASSVAGIIEPTLRAQEIRRAVERPTDDLTAYDLYLRALPQALSAEREKILEAIVLLGQAVDRDSRYAAALSLASLCHQFLCVSGWSEDEPASRSSSIDLARRALRVGADDPEVLATSGYVLGYFGENIDASISLIERALDLNPSYARGWVRSGWLRLWAGLPDVAIEHFEEAMRLNPRELNSHNFLAVGVAHFFAGRFEQARAMLLRSLQEEPNWVPTHRFLAACCAAMGKVDEARDFATRLRAMTHVLVPDATHWRKQAQRELYLSRLRLAMGEAE